MTLALIALSFAATALGVYIFKRFAARTNILLDIPNERSSHTRPVIRGAGLAMVVSVLGLYMTVSGSGAKVVFIFVAATVALVGLIDDLVSLSLWPRLTVHFAAAILLVYWISPAESIRVPFTSIDLGPGPFQSAIFVLFIVWTTNAFNFMDGIDGLAGIQGLIAGGGWVFFGMFYGPVAIAPLGALVLGACLGFLIFNWPPASVFMGDVGSTFLGFTLASMFLLEPEGIRTSRSEYLLLSFTFLWLFLFDTIYTRSKQILSLKPFWKPHRDHIYQQMVLHGSTHRYVSLLYGSLGLLIVVATVFRSEIGHVWMFVMIAVAPTTLLFLNRKKRLT